MGRTNLCNKNSSWRPRWSPAGWRVWLTVALLLPVSGVAAANPTTKHVVVVVWDGMRPDLVSAGHTPTLYALAQRGVTFSNHHALYCTSTEVNAAGLSTGCYQAASGIMANTDYRPELNPLKGIDTQAYDVVRRGDRLTGGRYLGCPTLAEIVQRAGHRSVVIGAKNVALLHDRAPRTETKGGSLTFFEGRTLPETWLNQLKRQFGAFPEAPKADAGLINIKRDEWVTRALIEDAWAGGLPAFSLLWLSEPDFTQHNTGPGSQLSVEGRVSSDRNLARVLAAIDAQGLREQTDVIVVSDHGFSTISKLIDTADVLRKAGFKAHTEFPVLPDPGQILVVNQGGSALFYVVGNKPRVVRDLVAFLQRQDFVGVVFTKDRRPGTFAFSDLHLHTRHAPDVAISMRWDATTATSGLAGQQMSNTRKAGEGNHASLSPFDIHNLCIAAGPNFRHQFVSSLPTGNIDIAPTILWILGIRAPRQMNGRVLSEALRIAGPPVGEPRTRRIEASFTQTNGTWNQYVEFTELNQTLYVNEGNGAFAPAQHQKPDPGRGRSTR
jgi:arylsulfatase A-like enzyme